jgi:hypothetical protein
LANIPTFLEVDIDRNQVTMLAPAHLNGGVSVIQAKDSNSDRVMASRRQSCGVLLLLISAVLEYGRAR